MAAIHQALVRVTMPQLGPLDDPVTISLAYESQSSGGQPANTADLINHVPDFFNVTAAGSTIGAGGYISPSVDRGANHCRIDVYDVGPHLNGTPHGSPVDSGTFTMLPTSGIPLPQGIAAAVSFRSDYGADVEFGVGMRPRARDRARFYLGPLTQLTCRTEDATNRCIFDPTFQTNILAQLYSIHVFATGIEPLDSVWALSVWTRKGATFKKATEAWMDDRPDYQRRRSDPGLKTFKSLA